MLCWLGEWDPQVGKFSSPSDKMRDLHEMCFPMEIKDEHGVPVEWPPGEWVFQSEIDPAGELECMWRPKQVWPPSRGPNGWGGSSDDYGFEVGCVKPGRRHHCTPLRGHRPPFLPLQEERRVYLTVAPDDEDSVLLVKSYSSCRKATAAEVRCFSKSTAANNVDRFDIYLSHCDVDQEEDAADIYVFLAPSELRRTGQVKPGVKPTL